MKATAKTFFPKSVLAVFIADFLRVGMRAAVFRYTNMIRRFAADNSGATAIECGLIALGIGVAVVTLTDGFNKRLWTTFNAVGSTLPNGK